MVEIPPVKKLDAVLHCINIARQPPFRSDGDLGKEIINSGISILPKELFEILHKLEEDKTCFSEIHADNIRYYYSTFDGQLLEKNGGYEAKFLAEAAAYDRDIAEIDRIKNVDERTLTYQNRLNDLTRGLICAGWAAAIATALYLLWSIFAYGLDHHWWFAPCCHCH